MEARFGYDFSGVRAHSGTAAEQSARDMNANAYTVRQNIVFGAGQFAPHQSFGRTLIAHELAHVVQQGSTKYPAASQGNCERDAEDAAVSVGSGNAPVVRTSAVSGTVQRQASTGPIAQASQKKSRLVRIERYWHSPSARAFFEDGSNEEVTFVEGGSLDPATQPEGAYEKVVGLTIDRSSPIRPHVEFAPHSSGSKVKVVTRLSPADRISKMPANIRGELSESFLGDSENESNPQTMEFAADMGDRLKETRGTTKIEMEGRDPATLARMRTVDQWVGDQQSKLGKLGTTRQAKFTRLLSDIRRVGVTGPVEAEDLSAQDIELVLAGAAGGQSDFRTFDEFKRGTNWELRSGKISLPAEAADNPDFFMRNEYRKAWKAEAAGLRRMSRIAAAAQAAPFLALGGSAVVGAGAAVGSAVVGWHAAMGVSGRLAAKYVATSLFAGNAVNQFMSARDEAKAADMDPNSLLGILNTASAGVLRAAGPGKIEESAANRSMLTQLPLNQSTTEQIVGIITGTAETFGSFGTFRPEAPNFRPEAPNVPAAATPRPIGKSTLPGAALAIRLRLSEVMQGAENARADLGLNTPASSMVETIGADSAPASGAPTVGETMARPDPAISPDLPSKAPQPAAEVKPQMPQSGGVGDEAGLGKPVSTIGVPGAKGEAASTVSSVAPSADALLTPPKASATPTVATKPPSSDLTAQPRSYTTQPTDPAATSRPSSSSTPTGSPDSVPDQTPTVEIRTGRTPDYGTPAISATPRAVSTRPMKKLPQGATRGSMGDVAGTPVAHPQSSPTVENRTQGTPDYGKPEYSVDPQTQGPDPWAAPPQPTKPSAPRAPRGHHQATGQAAQRAQALVDLQKGRVGMQEHRTAPEARAVLGQTGQGVESAHLVPQAVYQAIDASPDLARTVNVPKAVNTAIDRFWKPRWAAATRLGTPVTGKDIRNWVTEGIRNVPDSMLPQLAKNTLEWSLDSELKGLGITDDTVIRPGLPQASR
jgi:hypothetical protein